ncbi:MAG: multiubiquitin domain-containing protein [Planctomycetaceae bacterium]|nr:multiubiquitin domain-containing protein [Planctomycetaceae bacterium]
MTSVPDPNKSRADAKWAAIVDDQLIPLPRRQLPAVVILQQAGAPPNTALVRDFNSPNDVGFEPDSPVDLSEGNVFRTSTNCERRRQVAVDAPPKLAFFVDDHWEITIQPIQTGQSLRGLLAVSASLALLRDYESPLDEPIEDRDHIEFADGPVFITRPNKPHEITIVVEGTPHRWFKPTISYAEVVTLFDPNYPQYPDITYSVTFANGPNHKPEGILSPGGSIKVKDHMVFHVSATGQS